MTKILQHIHLEENRILREISTSVKDKEFGTPELEKLITDMIKIMKKEEDGVGIAAPQIGINKRIFVLNTDIAFDKNAKFKPQVFINPIIKKMSSKFIEKHEGCLSVRGFYGYTWRAKNLTIEASDMNGNRFTLGTGGLISHIIQHEIEHLNGILFIDHAFDIIEDKNWKDHLKKEERDRMLENMEEK